METPISWYPGHMARARRQIKERLRGIDAVIEVVDARAPRSSRNPDLQSLIARRQRVLVATKADLAEPEATEAWLAHWRKEGIRCAVAVDLRNTASRKVLLAALRSLSPRGASAQLKVMVVGTPNVGKSSLINRLAGRSPTRTGARPGVTRGQQWIHVPGGVHLLDTPGLLWPKLNSVAVGLRLAWIGCIGENAYEAEPTAEALLAYLKERVPERLAERYKIDPESGADLLEAIGGRRGMLLPGGRVDRLRAAETVLQEFRSGRLGRYTLELPGDDAREHDDEHR